MIKLLFFCLIVLLITESCETIFYSKGIVVDNISGQPVANAKISVKEIDTIITDSLGRYNILKLVGGNIDLEIMIEKKGYLPKYVNFSQESYNRDSTVIKMQPIVNEFKPAFPKKYIFYINNFNKYALSLFNLLTIIFIVAYKELRWRYLWIVGILFINLEICLLYLDGKLIYFNMINGPIYFFTPYWIHPYSIRIIVPIVSIIFWILIMIKPQLIKKHQDKE